MGDEAHRGNISLQNSYRSKQNKIRGLTETFRRKRKVDHVAAL